MVLLYTLPVLMFCYMYMRMNTFCAYIRTHTYVRTYVRMLVYIRMYVRMCTNTSCAYVSFGTCVRRYVCIMYEHFLCSC